MPFRNQLVTIACAAVAVVPVVRATQIELTFSLTEFGNPSHVIAGSASLAGISMGDGTDAYHAIGGSVTVNGIADSGFYDLLPVGPSLMVSPSGAFAVDNMVYTTLDPHLDLSGLLGFKSSNGVELNIWGVGPGVYSVYAWTPGSGYTTTFTGWGSMSVNVLPDSGSSVAVPDGGMTIGLLGSGLAVLGYLRRKLG